MGEELSSTNINDLINDDTDVNDDVVDKILNGKMNKFYSEVTLLNQTYILDQDKTVRNIIEENSNSNFHDVNLYFAIKFKNLEFSIELICEFASISKLGLVILKSILSIPELKNICFK